MTLEQIDQIIIENHSTLEPIQIMELTGLPLPKYRGRVSSLCKRNKIVNTRNLTLKVTGKFKNNTGAKKAQAREKILSFIKDSKIYGGKILTLPSKSSEMELLLLNKVSKKYRFDAHEYDREVYNQLLVNVAKNDIPMNCSNEPISDSINLAKENYYSHLILDYCGMFNTFYKEIGTAITNKIVPIGGTMSMTLNKRSHASKGGIEEQMYKIQSQRKGMYVEDTITTFLKLKCEDNYEVVCNFSYTDRKPNDKKNAHMILLILKRIK